MKAERIPVVPDSTVPLDEGSNGSSTNDKTLTPKPPPKIPPDLAALLTLGGNLAVWIGGGTLLGHWAGGRWGFEPWGTLAGALFGIAGAGIGVYRIVRRLDSKGPGRPPAGEPLPGDEGRPKNTSEAPE